MFTVFSDCEKLKDDVLNDFGSIDVLINNGITKDNLQTGDVGR